MRKFLLAASTALSLIAFNQPASAAGAGCVQDAMNYYTGVFMTDAIGDAMSRGAPAGRSLSYYLGWMRSSIGVWCGMN